VVFAVDTKNKTKQVSGGTQSYSTNVTSAKSLEVNEMEIIQAPPGIYLLREGESTKVYAFVYSRGISGNQWFPVTSPVCEYCDESIFSYLVTRGSRVNGDSRFGYNAIHETCAEKQRVEIEAKMAELDAHYAATRPGEDK
jgi:hypothetical protein